MKDQTKVELGSWSLKKPEYGPLIDEALVTRSHNTITASSGVFLEDYYYDSSCFSEGSSEHLNQFNGHSHDGIGFHYHFTVDRNFKPVFPFTVGPKFYGCRNICCDIKGRCTESRELNCGNTDGAYPTEVKCHNSSKLVSNLELLSSLTCQTRYSGVYFMQNTKLVVGCIVVVIFSFGYLIYYECCRHKSRVHVHVATYSRNKKSKRN